MERINGFINVDKMLKEIGVEHTNIDSLKNEIRINRIDKFFGLSLRLEFDYYGETYFYKCNEGGLLFPYSELVAEELAKDYGIPCVSYDLATLNGKNGVISKNYKKKNVNYISAEDILSNYFNKYHDGKCLNIDDYNNLDSIWTALDYRYKDSKNKIDITYHLMKQIVDVFLFDIITCQNDRHTRNWEIMEQDDNINISPLYDNERVLICSEEDATISMTINEIEDENLWETLKEFQHLSSNEFGNLIAKKLWIISEENLMSVFQRIEKKTNYPMPQEYKDFYLDGYKKHKERIEEIVYNKPIKKESSRKK